MIRFSDKNDWKNKIDKCWDISARITTCLKGSRDFQSANQEAQDIITKNLNSSAIKNYINAWASGKSIENPLKEESQEFYQNNKDLLSKLETECKISELSECFSQTYSLKNFEGDYEREAAKHFK